MATVSGRILFDRARTASPALATAGLANVPVVLQNTATNERLAVFTDINGNYSFINVPNGNYRIVEAFGTPAVATPGNFSNAVVGAVPSGVVPPIGFAPNPPPGSTNLDCVTPNTLLVTVSGANLTNQDILNGPVRYTPITTILDSCATIFPTNLITAADNGTFGTFPQGTPANTGAPTEPYPGLAPDFIYVLPQVTPGHAPEDGEYTVQNIMNNDNSNTIGAWWRIADHTTGNETGRMQVVNGFEPGSIFFTAQVSVNPNTNYLFSAWILNMFKAVGFPNPALGVQVLDQNGQRLYSATLGMEIPVNFNTPEWKQIGTVINSQNNSSLTVEFLSEGPAAIGNDYAIDDVVLDEIEVPVFTPVKSVSASGIAVGETVTYTITLTNTCESPLTNVVFQDTAPNGLSFVSGTVTVNGVTQPGADPNAGFTVPNIPGGGAATVTFIAMADFVPSINPTINSARMTYDYTPVEGGIPMFFDETSNEVPVEIEEPADLADVAVQKRASTSAVTPGSTLTYTITVTNAGPAASEDVVLTDSVPADLLNPEFSTDGGTTFQPWTGSFTIGTMPPGTMVTIIIRGTVDPNATTPLVNTAQAFGTTPDPNLANNTSTVTTAIAGPRCQAITDIIESVALQEAALAHILNAEGEKIQAIVSMTGATSQQMLDVNASVTRVVNGIVRLETVLQAKLDLVSGVDCGQ